MAEEPKGAPSGESPKLDDLMLAMDVVDTLRHQDTLIERELGQEERDVELRRRLREIYEGQGLEVTDRVLNQGIEALRYSRFRYERRGGGWQRALALTWVWRQQVAIGLAVVALVVVGAFVWSSWQSSMAAQETARIERELTEILPAAISAAGQAALDAADDPAAITAIEALISDGEAALARSDADAAQTAITALEDIRGDLLLEYRLRIVSRPGEQTGVFRIPDVNQAARNYYIIVEAVTPDGRVLTLPVTSEEDGSVADVDIWAVRVPKATYDAVAGDKRADGIVDDDTLGVKSRGTLTETYEMDVEDGRIRQW